MAYPVYLAGYIDKVGTGTEDMVKDCLASGLSAPVFVQEFEFTTTIWRKGYGPDGTFSKNGEDSQDDKQNDKQNDNLSKRQRAILKSIGENIFLNIEDLMKIHKVSQSTISRELKKLHIWWEGSSKKGHWHIGK